MKILLNNNDLNEALNNVKNLGFVPTMGSLHKGHISLIKESLRKTNKTIVSIFINHTQFNNKNDFIKYPKDIKRDLKILSKKKVDYVFIPSTSEIYKKKIKNFVIYNKDKILCAKFRKGHFEGVLNIMNRLLSIIKSKYTFMGEKDFQQIFLLEKYLNKNTNTKFIKCKTIRDNNMIALSSRNFLLTKKNYKLLALLIKEIFIFIKKIKTQKNNINNLLIKSKKLELENKFNIWFEYFEIRDENKLQPSKLTKNSRLFVAYKIDEIRLIDNFKL